MQKASSASTARRAAYDLTLTLSQTNASGAPLREVWRYEGLTRRDPTLQCYSGFSQRSGSLQLHVALDGFPQQGGPFVVAAFASRDLGMGWWVDKADFAPPALSWFGPDPQTAGNLHALLYQTDPTGLPIAYQSHALAQAQIGGAPTDVTLSFPSSTIPSIMLSGRVTGPHERARSDLLVQHFADGTELTIPLSIQALDTFSYLAPSLPDSSTTVVVREGGSSPPYAAAVIEGGASERSDLSLEIPRTPQLTAPGDGKSGVDETTDFGWTLSEPRVAMLVAYSDNLGDILYVVTDSTETRLPTGAAFGYTVPAGTSFSWYVYTRDATSIDDVTADADHTLLTTQWTTGHYAASIPRTFVTAELRRVLCGKHDRLRADQPSALARADLREHQPAELRARRRGVHARNQRRDRGLQSRRIRGRARAFPAGTRAAPERAYLARIGHDGVRAEVLR